MSRPASSPSLEAQDTLRALRRAARNALELGLKTGTPVWVIKNNKMVDLTKDKAVVSKLRLRHSSAKKSVSTKKSRPKN